MTPFARPSPNCPAIPATKSLITHVPSRPSIRQTLLSTLTIVLAIVATPLYANDPKPEAPEKKAPAPAPAAEPAYRIETIALPDGFDPRIGALAFNEGEELVVVSQRTGILIGHPADDPATFTWRTYCDQSLHNPLGVLAETGGSLLVPQVSELTRLYDTDNDGRSDYFESVSADWGVSGNSAQTNTGPLPDGEGNWFIALGNGSVSAPANAATFSLMRGDYSPAGRRGQTFSATPFNGWIVKVTAEGDMLPWASGLRQCNGIGMNAARELFATDSYGDWKPASAVYHIEQGKFYGHPNSLVWDKDFATEHPDPLGWAVADPGAVDRMRSRAVVLIPHDSLCTAPGEPLFDPGDGAFGPFTDQLFIGDTAGQRIVRVMLDQVDGQYQGAVTHFIDSPELGSGNQRLCFSPDGRQLYVGQTQTRGKGASDGGLKRITWTGSHTPFAVSKMSLAADGFEFSFTHAVDRQLAADVANYRVRHYHYAHDQKTDNAPLNVIDITPRRAILTPDARGVTLQFDKDQLIPGRIYEFDLAKVTAGNESKTALDHGILCYTLNKLRPESKGVIKFKPRPEPDPAVETDKAIETETPAGNDTSKASAPAAADDAEQESTPPVSGKPATPEKPEKPEKPED